MKVGVAAILFARISSTNARTLLGQFKGQYDLRLGSDAAFDSFSTGVADQDPTNNGGWTRAIPIEAVEGANPVPAQALSLRFMGPQSQRKDFYFRGQTTSPYPLWAPSRTHAGSSAEADLIDDVALVVRDVEGRFHARWVQKADVGLLPEELRRVIASEQQGVFVPTEPSSAISSRAQEVVDALRAHHNVLLYGPPGTGKTHLVTEVRRQFTSSGLTLDTATADQAIAGGGSVHSEWTTFHQSYSYEDFVVGLRPKPLGGGGFELIPRPGVLLGLAEWARLAGNESLLIIDEINRGNVSRIFGEFITLMEPDKRLAEDGSETEQTVSVRLPFIDEGHEPEVSLPDGTTVTVATPFTMPRRVYTLATMNSVDKSVAPLDSALRRRFHVIHIAPNVAEFAASHLGLSGNPTSDSWSPQTPRGLSDYRWLGAAALAVINSRIAVFLGNDYELGEWFLRPLVDAEDSPTAAASLAEIWRTALMPQLEDYFVGRADQLSAVLGESAEVTPALVVAKPDSRQVEVGASPSIRGNPSADDTDVIKLLEVLVKSADLYAAPSTSQAVSDVTESTDAGESVPGGGGGEDARD